MTGMTWKESGNMYFQKNNYRQDPELNSVTFHTEPLESDTIDTFDTFLYSKKYLFN